jgi:hypothetical protein
MVFFMFSRNSWGNNNNIIILSEWSLKFKKLGDSKGLNLCSLHDDRQVVTIGDEKVQDIVYC